MAIIEGTIESVTFRNEENGWTVITLKEGKNRVTVVGTLGELIPGERAQLEGEYTEHSEYGRQFRATSCEVLPPDTKKGMEKFLSSGAIRGIGPATAKLLLDAFGLTTFDVLENEPHRLTEISGIGPKKAAQIAESFAEKREMRQTMVFLQTYGLSAQLAAKIYRFYGSASVDIVRRQPYRLVTDIKGVGFPTADALARAMGIPELDPGRLKAGVHYTVNEAVNSGGHCYLPYDLLLSQCRQLLHIDMETAENTVRDLLLQGALVRRTVAEGDAVYTAAMYDAEGEVAQRLAQFAATKYKVSKRVGEKIAQYERESGVTLSDEQRAAVEQAAGGGLTVVTGGPGTGKTTCIRCMLEALAFAGKIVLCAPTGRAAKRMSEASGCDASTIHRLLEYGGEDEMFQRNEDDPVDAHVLIVDEVSMCDLYLMRGLLRALRPSTRVVFVGDRDQLPPVGAGNVLADLIASGVAPVIELKRIYRQGDGSRIVENAHRINTGMMPLCNGKGSDFFFERAETQTEAANAVVRLVAQRLPGYLHVDPMTSIQTMAPMKKGEAGVWNMNVLLQNALNPRREGCELVHGESVFRVGDRVMQTRNDYQREWTENGTEGAGVFNGDIGYVTNVDPQERTLTVCFDDTRYADYEDADIEDLELAYCMSVHKSQGGEFEAVVVPVVSGPPMLLTRNLLYTAVTRAKKLVVLVGRVNCISAMVQNDHVARRYSDLAARLRDMATLFAKMDDEERG